MKEKWFIILTGEPKGIFSAEEVRQLIDEGEVPNGTLVWKKGLVGWQPVELHFSCSIGTEQSKNADRERSHSSIDFIPPEPPQLFVSLVLAAAGIAGFLYVFLKIDHWEATKNLYLYWYSTLFVALSLCSFFLVKLWKRGIAYWQVSATKIKGGVLKLICLLSSASLLAFTLVFGYQGTALLKIIEVRKDYKKYVVDVDPAARVLSIKGTIGPGLFEEVRNKLSLHSHIDTVLINSPGGLADEGLNLADFILARGNLKVTAVDQCNSACIPILLAGAARVADWHLKLGFHAISEITELDKVLQGALKEETARYYNFLRQRGVQEHLLSRILTTGPESMEYVSAIELLESGILSGLLSNGEAVSTDFAKWLFLEQQSAGTENGVLNFLQTIRKSAPAYVSIYAPPLYKALVANDITETVKLITRMKESILAEAWKSADGQILLSFLSVQTKQAVHLAKMEQWQPCAEYMNGAGLDQKGMDLISKPILERELEITASLVTSAARNNWTPRPTPSWVSARGQEWLAEVLRSSFDSGYIDREANPLGHRGSCLFNIEANRKILQLDANIAAPLYRAILTDQL